MEPRLNVNK